MPCLQQLGLDAISVDTAMLSNHPAHGAFRGRVVPPEEVDELLKGVAENISLSPPAALLSGYLGTVETGRHVLREAAARTAATPYCLDPVMGDNGQIYVNEDLIAFFRGEALAAADMVVPNAFEAGLLTGHESCTLENAPAILRELLSRGPSRIAITGLEMPQGVATLAGDENGMWLVETPMIDVATSGAGDTFAALLLGNLLTDTVPFPAAVAAAVNSLFDILTLTKKLARPDLALVDGLAYIRDPVSRYNAAEFAG